MKQYPENTIQVPRFSEANGFYTTKERSVLMGKIKATNTKPEQKLRRILWALGLRYRLNVKTLPGKPDIVLRRFNLVIFIDGEFWHGHNWEVKKEKIKSNRGFWLPKIERNIQRDQEVNQQLSKLGFNVIRFWDHQINNDFNWCLQTILDYISESLNEEIVE
jgi:DNA mismatch endonuclease (patch repair protein)